MGEVGKHIGRNDDRNRGADAQLEANLVRHAEHAEDFVQNRNNERAAADSEKPRENARDESGDNDQSREQQELAHGHTQDHILLRRQRRMDQAAALCSIWASISTTRASAWRNAATPAAGLEAPAPGWRRKPRAPATPRNRPRRAASRR